MVDEVNVSSVNERSNCDGVANKWYALREKNCNMVLLRQVHCVMTHSKSHIAKLLLGLMGL